MNRPAPVLLLLLSAVTVPAGPALAQTAPATQRPSSAVHLSVPDRVDTGATVAVTGTTSDPGTVRILFRKRGQQAFSVRRTLTPAADGSFSTDYVADDDYRLYAETDRGTSPLELVQAVPVVRAPATVAAGAGVVLTVRATPHTAVAVSFRRQGQTSFSVRRTGRTDGSGRYVTRYVADADQRYFVDESGGQRSGTVLTQLRGARSVEVSNDPAFPGQVVALDAPVVARPGTRVPVTFTGADGRSRELGPVLTRRDGSVSTEVMVPTTAAPGRAVLQVGTGTTSARGAVYVHDR